MKVQSVITESSGIIWFQQHWEACSLLPLTNYYRQLEITRGAANAAFGNRWPELECTHEREKKSLQSGAERN
jgi:hypothetical protein